MICKCYLTSCPRDGRTRPQPVSWLLPANGLWACHTIHKNDVMLTRGCYLFCKHFHVAATVFVNITTWLMLCWMNTWKCFDDMFWSRGFVMSRDICFDARSIFSKRPATGRLRGRRPVAWRGLWYIYIHIYIYRTSDGSSEEGTKISTSYYMVNYDYQLV